MKQVLTIKEACAHLKLSRVSVHKWCKDGTLEKITVPGKRRVYITKESVSRITG